MADGTRGPKKTPAAQLKKTGTFRKDRHSDELNSMGALEFVYDFVPTAPESLTKKAQEKWYQVLAGASRLNGYISTIDLSLLEQYCTLYVEMTELAQEKQHHDYIYYTESGPRIHPIHDEYRKSVTAFNRIAREFGFTPSARTGIRLTQLPKAKEKEDDFEIN